MMRRGLPAPIPLPGVAAGLLAVCSGLLATACAGPEVHRAESIRFNGEEFDQGDEEVRDVQVEVRSYLDVDVEVRDVAGRVRSGRFGAQFRLRNDESGPVRLRLSWEWRDADGFALRDAASERPEQRLVLQPGEERALTYTSPSPRAIQFIASLHETAPSR